VTESNARMVATEPTANDIWEPVVIGKDQISREVERLLSCDVADPCERQVRITHPKACARGMGLAPGIEVRLSVLKPGEQARPYCHNATEVGFCIEGEGRVQVQSVDHKFERYDVWNVPSWSKVVCQNPSRRPVVWLTYSNAPLLRLLNVHLVESEKTTGIVKPEQVEAAAHADGGIQIRDLFQIPGDETWLMSYERLINPPAVESASHLWRWSKVKAELDKLTALGAAYRGRRLYLLYNPMTGRTNGTVRPPNIIDRPHRHASAAINYYFSGAGYSRVAGKHYEWAAGDLMLSAPGWAIHNHASHDQGPVYELTIQDQPFHIWQESLLWQESLAKPPALLGAQPGFHTNREELMPS